MNRKPIPPKNKFDLSDWLGLIVVVTGILGAVYGVIR